MGCLSPDAGANDAEAGLLLTLFDRGLGLARLEKGLSSPIPHTRAEAAAALALIGGDDALAALARSSTIEALSLLAALRGEPPVRMPEPVGKLVEWRGELRPVYALHEIVLASTPETTVAQIATLQRRFGALLRIWNV